jgi:hypothetical protein
MLFFQNFSYFRCGSFNDLVASFFVMGEKFGIGIGFYGFIKLVRIFYAFGYIVIREIIDRRVGKFFYSADNFQRQIIFILFEEAAIDLIPAFADELDIRAPGFPSASVNEGMDYIAHIDSIG